MKIYFTPLLWILAFAAAMLPFAGYEAKEFSFAFLILAIGVSFLILKNPLESGAPKWSLALFIPAGAFWALAFVSVLFSQVPYVSLVYFCFFSVMPLSLLWALFAQRREDFFMTVSIGLAVVFGVLSLASIVQFFALPAMLQYGRAHLPFADPNSLAGFLTPAFFAALGVMVAAQKKSQSNIALVMAILIIGAIFATGSRGAILAIVAGVAVFIPLLWPQVKHHKKCCGILLLAVIALFAAMQGDRHILVPAMDESAAIAQKYFGGMPSPEEAKGAASAGQRVEETLSGNLPALYARPAIWHSTWEIIRAHFWTGTGIGTFYLYYPGVRSSRDEFSAGRMAHSDPLQFWAEMGVFAPVLFYIFIAAAIVLTFRALGKMPRGDARRARLVVPFCGLGALVLHAHVTFHFYVLGILMLAGLLLAYWYVQLRDVLGGEPMKLPGREMLKAVMIAPVMLLSLAFFMLQASAIETGRAVREAGAGDIDGMTRSLNMAARMSMNKDAAPILMAVNLPLNFLLALEKPLALEDALANYTAGKKYLDEAEKLNPRLADIPFMRARLVKVIEGTGVGQEVPAEDLLQQALRLDPLHYEARLMLAQIYRNKDETAKAFQTLNEGRAWINAADEPVEFYSMLATAAIEYGDKEAEGWALKMMSRYFPARGPQ